jgi:hypothetical protein
MAGVKQTRAVLERFGERATSHTGYTVQLASPGKGMRRRATTQRWLCGVALPDAQ